MIQIDANALEARYANKTGAVAQPAPMQDLGPTNKQGQIPMGTPVPEGQIIRQNVGRGQSMGVVPPRTPETNAPAMAVIPPTGSARTSLGTYVEVTPTVSNPLTSPPAQIIEELKPAKKPLDLTQLILDHMFELGGEKSEDCQKFYNRSQQTLKNWMQNPANITLEAVNRFLKRAPEIKDDILELLEPHFAYDGQDGTWSLPNRGKLDMMVCMPVLGQPTLPFFWTMLYLAKKYELGFDVQADTMIVRSRNMLAKRFLNSGCQWSLWVDCDIAAPIANGNYFRWLTGSTTISNEACEYDVVDRLLSHKKPIVGGVYASRRYHGGLVIQPEIRPRSHEDKLLANQIRRGQGQGLAGVEWLGFGCCLVHREVFLEVQRRYPGLAPQEELAPWDFFRSEGIMGEDEAFCQKVRSASIPIWLDTQLVCGHVGHMLFLPEHTASQMAL